MQSSIWKAGAIVGATLTLTAVAAGYVDVATHFRFNFLSDYFGTLLLAGLIGVVMSSVGLVGWARRMGRGSKARMAGLVFISPWIVFLLGYPIAGDNVHGPAMLVVVLMIPAIVLAVILLIMAGLTRSPEHTIDPG